MKKKIRHNGNLKPIKYSAEKIIKDLNKYKQQIIQKLSDGNGYHFRRYLSIRDNFSRKSSDADFKKHFCAFYRINGRGGLNNIQKKRFFELLFRREKSLSKILTELYNIPDNSNRHKLFLSFGTKLLHTINNDLPIYDRNIAYVLKLKKPIVGKCEIEIRINDRQEIYKELNCRFRDLLLNLEINNFLKGIRKELSETAEYENLNLSENKISRAKLLDSSLWSLYDYLK